MKKRLRRLVGISLLSSIIISLIAVTVIDVGMIAFLIWGVSIGLTLLIIFALYLICN